MQPEPLRRLVRPDPGVGKCLEKCSIAAIILYALGFMLAYTVFLFTFPEKRKRNENR